MAKTIKIGGRLESVETGNIVAGANQIIDDDKHKRQSVINGEVDAELVRLDETKQGNLTFDNAPTEDSNNPVKSGGVYAADKLLSDAIEAILLLIPSAASALNKLVDMQTMNSSIATATATFRGTYNVVSDLELAYNATHEQIAAKLDEVIATADNNDYAFVQIPVSATSQDIAKTERYKFNGEAWAYEYDLNNSGFTQAQWNAINSTITAALVSKLSALPTATELQTALNGKQNNLTFDQTPASGSQNPVTSGGIYARNAEIVALITALDAAKQDKLTFDSNPTQNSSNPVTSNGVYVAVSALQASIIALDAAKQDVLTFDSTPTLGSNNPVTSSGIKTETNRLNGLISDNAAAIVTLNNLYQALTQSALVVVAPTDTWPVANPNTTTIYRVVDRVNTPPQYYSDYMWNGTSMVQMAQYDNAIDNVPTAVSNNLVKSGGVFSSTNRLNKVHPQLLLELDSTIGNYGDKAIFIVSNANQRVVKRESDGWFTDPSFSGFIQVGQRLFYKSGTATTIQFEEIGIYNAKAYMVNSIPSSSLGIDGEYAIDSSKVYYKTLGGWKDVTTLPVFWKNVIFNVFAGDTLIEKYRFIGGTSGGRLTKIDDSEIYLLDGLIANGNVSLKGLGVTWDAAIIKEMTVTDRELEINVFYASKQSPSGYADLSLFISQHDKSGTRIAISEIQANTETTIKTMENTYIVRIWCYLGTDSASSTDVYTINGLKLTVKDSIYSLSNDIAGINEQMVSYENLKNACGDIAYFRKDLTFRGNGEAWDYPITKYFHDVVGKTFCLSVGDMGSDASGAYVSEMGITYREYNSSNSIIKQKTIRSNQSLKETCGTNVSYVRIDFTITTGTVSSIVDYYYKAFSMFITDGSALKDWINQGLSWYGDSIAATYNGDFHAPFQIGDNEEKALQRVAAYHLFANAYGRGVGAQRFTWGSHGGSVAWVDEVTGNYVGRNDSYNYDNYEGHVEIPEGCVAIRGCLCSWLRITKMFPESIKDQIGVILLQNHNDANESSDMVTAPSFIDNDVTDAEWAASTYYATYGGDYNIGTVKGAIASLIMKVQAWMPNTRIVLMTPISGQGTTGELNKGLSDEYMQKLSDCVKEMHNLMSVPCIDVYGNCGINGLNRTRFITDNIHPYSANAAKALASAIKDGLKIISPIF